MQIVNLVFLVVLTIVGYGIILAVPPLLHTPLMAGMNALSGITVLGAVIVVATQGLTLWGGLAVVAGMINVVGGFWVTERMLRMFRADDRSQTE